MSIFRFPSSEPPPPRGPQFVIAPGPEWQHNSTRMLRRVIRNSIRASLYFMMMTTGPSCEMLHPSLQNSLENISIFTVCWRTRSGTTNRGLAPPIGLSGVGRTLWDNKARTVQTILRGGNWYGSHGAFATVKKKVGCGLQHGG